MPDGDRFAPLVTHVDAGGSEPARIFVTEGAVRGRRPRGRREGRNVRVLVIGAGIGGLTTAIALRRRGVDVTVLERTPKPGPVGAGITLWPNATRLLRALGIGDAIAAVGAPAPAGEVRSWRGCLLMGMAVPNLEERYGAPGVALHRADLLRVLLRAAGAATVRFGAEATALSEDVSGVTVRLADGREERGEAVVGADGLRSMFRTQLWGNEPPRYAGYTAWRGVVHFPFAGGATESWGAGQRFGLVPIGSGRLYWFATANVLEGGRDAADPRPDLLRRFGSWHEPIPQVVATTAATPVLRNDVYDREPRTPWGVGRVTLLGDAAHPMTPNLGQGACQAIEDAVVLAAHLVGAADVPSALRAFEAARHARTRTLVLRSRHLGRVGQWEWAPLLRLRDAAIRRVPARAQLRQLDAILGYDAAASGPTHPR